MKKRIAVWLHGGIGTGRFSQGNPIIVKLLEKLSETFEVVVYSQSAPYHDFNVSFFQIRSASHNVKNRLLRWLYLVRYFVHDHRGRKFQLLFAFWGYPTGVLVTCLQKIMKLPGVVYLQGSDAAGIPSVDFGVLHKPFQRFLAKWAYRETSRLLCMTKFQQDSLLKHGISRAVYIIPCGVDLSMFKFRLKIPGSVLQIIHVGHLNRVKDQGTLLRAFAILIKQQPSRLRIFGVDCLGGQLQKLCRELNIEKHVQFLDMLPHVEMPAQYGSADIIFHTSLSEGQCMALTEAAASGVLLAGTRVGLLYDLGDGYGITVEPGDYKNLAEKTISILNKPEELKTKIELARRWSEDHDLRWTVSQLTELLHSL